MSTTWTLTSATVLLFVFWYCHKRGRETRLDQERLAAEDAESMTAEADDKEEEKEEESSDDGATDMEETVVLEPEQQLDKKDAPASDESSELPAALKQDEPKEVPLPG
jgi:hypothetical protein